MAFTLDMLGFFAAGAPGLQNCSLTGTRDGQACVRTSNRRFRSTKVRLNLMFVALLIVACALGQVVKGYAVHYVGILEVVEKGAEDFFLWGFPRNTHLIEVPK